MNKFFARAALLLLLLSLCACSKGHKQEQNGRQSVPELESIVEPVDGDEASSEAPDAFSGPESFPSTASGGMPPVDGEPVSGPGPDVPGVYVPEPVVPPSAGSSEPEAFASVASDVRLDVEVIEKELLRLINSLRGEEGVNALGIEDGLQFAARIRAAEALESFSHTRPDGTPYNTAFDESGFSYAGKLHGENLSSLGFSYGMFGEKEIALEMFKGLKNSPGHYRNMTETNFVQAGVGVAVSYSEDTVSIASAQMFSSL